MYRVYAHLTFVLILFTLLSCGAKETKSHRVGQGNKDQVDTPNQSPSNDNDSGVPKIPKSADPKVNNSPSSPDDKNEPPRGGVSDIATLLAQSKELIKESDLNATLQYLASDELEGRATCSDGFEKAAEYVKDFFQKNGVAPGNETSYFQSLTVNDLYTDSSCKSTNIVGLITGTDPNLKNEVIIIGAHLDHLGQSQKGIFNGADDNASGSTGLIYLAKAFARLKDKLKRSIMFIAFTGEESGLVGSRHYVANPILPLDKTTIMINLDMIGYYKSSGALTVYYGTDSTLTEHVPLLKEVNSKNQDLTITFKRKNQNGNSDHIPFRENGISAIFFNTGSHENFHKTSDTAEKVDSSSMTNITKLTFDFIWELARH